MQTYKLKQIPEDFRVKEIINLEFEKGRYAYYKLIKKGYTTQRAVEIIAKKMGIKTKFINFAGNKDRNSIAEQYISILHGKKKGFEIPGIKLEYLGQGKKRINLGSLQGNEFEITIRNVLKKPKILSWFPNYFDVQRFGKNLNNHLIGKYIVKRKFDKACNLLPEVQEYLKKYPRDFIGALRILPKRTLRLICNSYQSYLWNLTVCEVLKKYKHVKIFFPLGELVVPKRKPKLKEIPIFGYNSEVIPEMEKVIKKEDIKQEDFKIKEMPELDLRGDLRKPIIEVKSWMGRLEEDEFNPGKKKFKLKFYLPKGSYATMFVRVLFGR